MKYWNFQVGPMGVSPSPSLFHSNRRPASAQRLRPTMSPPVSSASSTSPSASGSKTAMRPPAPAALLHRSLPEQEVPLRAELIALHALAEEVDVLRVVHRHPGRLVGDSLVDAGPRLVRRSGGGDCLHSRLIHLRLDRLAAE